MDSGGVHGLCSDPFCRSWLDLVSIGPGWDLGMKKHQRLLAGAGGVGGMVGVLGEEGPSWTSSIVTHFTDDACIVIDHFQKFFEIFLPFCRFCVVLAAVFPYSQ